MPQQPPAPQWGSQPPQQTPPHQRPDGMPVGSALPPMDLSPAPMSRSTRRAVSRFVWVAAACALLATVGLAVSVYSFLATIDVFGFLVAGRSLFSTMALAGIALSCALALVGFVIAIVGTVRSGRRAVGVVVLVAALLLPIVSGVAGGVQGASVLKERTVTEAQEYASQISPEQIDEVYDMVEGFGVELPGREELKEIVERGHQVLGTGDGESASDGGGNPGDQDG